MLDLDLDVWFAESRPFELIREKTIPGPSVAPSGREGWRRKTSSLNWMLVVVMTLPERFLRYWDRRRKDQN